jgi:hypothetical protein
MAAETQYTANTGIGQAVTANSNLDGTGSLVTVITGASNGTLIRSVTICALGDTSEGMVRLFVYNGANSRLIREFHVNANDATGTNPAYCTKWDCNIKLKSGYELRASTQTGDDFNVIAEGLNWTYFTSAVRPESTKYTANTGTVSISTANSNRDGTGSLGTVLTAGSDVTYNGCKIDRVIIKGLGTVTMGMVRLFLYDTTNTRLVLEVPVVPITASGTEAAFEVTIPVDFNMKAGWSLKASTENAESFAVTAEGSDWNYPAATSSTNVTPISGTATTSEEKLHTLTVPASVFTTGDILRVYAYLEGTGSANNKTYRMYVNTSDSLSGATLLATVVTSSLVSTSFMRLFSVLSDTSLCCYAGTTNSLQHQYTANPNASGTTTVPSVSASFYILISGQKDSSGETDTIKWSMWKKEN